MPHREAPTYLRIKSDFLARIRSGELKPGSSIPGDAEVAELFGCARQTAHRALRELADEGVIERRRRAGSRVALRTSQTARFEISRIDREIEATGAEYRYELLDRQAGSWTSLARERLAASRETPVLHLLCLHFANDVPFQLEERWIRLDTVPSAARQSFAEVGPNAWLLEHVPWSDAEHQVSAISASASVARRLRIDAGSPLLLLERRTWLDPQQPVTYVRLSHPGDFYHLRSRASQPKA